MHPRFRFRTFVCVQPALGVIRNWYECTALFSEVERGSRDQILLSSEYDEPVFKARRITHCIPSDVFIGLAVM